MENPLNTTFLLCRNYHYLKSLLDPYLKSTYHDYAMEHVETMRPYLKNIQENANKYGRPIVFHIKNQYKAYAHPHVLYAKEGMCQYIKKYVEPIGMTYFKTFNEFYTTRLRKYVINLETVYWKNIHSGICTSIRIAHHFYKSKCVTFYYQIKPHVIQLLKSIFYICRKEIYPWIVRALIKLKDFFFTCIVPKFNLFWEIHVTPQLERIHNRIFQYKDVDSNINFEVHSNKIFESFDQDIYSKKSTSKVNIETPLAQVENRLISEMLSLWTDHLNRIGKGIEDALIDDLLNLLLPIIYGKEKSVIQNLLSELNSLVDSEILEIKNKIISENSVLKDTTGRDAHYNINDIKKAGKAIHAKASEIRTYLKSIENDCKKKIIKKSRLSFNQIVMFQSEMASLFEVFIKSNIKDENHKRIYDEYFDFKNLIDTIEKRFFDSVLNATLSSVEQIRALSINAEVIVNNIVGLAARQLKDFKSVNASNNIIQKLYNDSTNSEINNDFLNITDKKGNNFQKTFQESQDQAFISNSYEQKSLKTYSESHTLNTKSETYIETQANSFDSKLMDTKSTEKDKGYSLLSCTHVIHLQKESIRRDSETPLIQIMA
ncbi:hypothetical protein PCANB_001065 [Pneumocystis canis]|nr:hypothetical protein PCANB_001065 [Pneumocystis canis]